MASLDAPKRQDDSPVVIGVLAGVLAFFIMMVVGMHSSKTDEVRTAVYECIEQKSKADGFPGTLAEAWETYYSVCQ